MIVPTIGRVVWFWPAGSTVGDQPMAAIVTGVWGDGRHINLAIFERNGVPKSHPPTSIRLVQEEDERPMDVDGNYVAHATWMPYQIGQAKKNA